MQGQDGIPNFDVVQEGEKWLDLKDLKGRENEKDFCVNYY